MCVTPFTGEGDLDERGLRGVVRFLAGAGVGIYLGSYGTGEGHLLRPAEVRALYRIGVEEAAGRVPVYAACLGFAATAQVVEDALEAVELGVDAVQIHPPRPGPTAIVPRSGELERYYADVLGSLGCPIHLTNQVVMVGYSLPDGLVGDLLASYPGVAAVNTSDPDLRSVARLIECVGGRAPVYVGIVAQLVTALALGAAGALCFEADVAPLLCRQVVDDFATGNVAALRRSLTALLRLNDVLSRYQNPRSVKAAMRAMGLPAGNLRRPYLDLRPDEDAAIASVLDELGIDPVKEP
jgi:4-hydroxy-tetrahydrodipicolinate synthase